MRPLATYCPKRPTSTSRKNLLQLTPAGRVLAVFPDHPFAVLHHVLRDERDDVLAVIVEADLADDRVLVAGPAQLLDHFPAVGPDVLDHIHDQARRREGERAIRLRPLVVLLLQVFADEEQPAGQLFPRRAFDEGQAALGELAESIDVRVELDARGAFYHRIDAEPLHLRADAHADRRQAAEIDYLGLELLRLGELGGEVLLVGGDAEASQDLAAVRGQVLGEVLVVPFAVVRGVVNDDPALVLQAGHELRRDVVLVDHRAVDAMYFGVFVAVGDVGKHRAPHHRGKAELVIGVHGCDRRHGAVVRDPGDDGVVGGSLGRGLHGDVGLAFVVEAQQLVVVLGLGIGVPQPHRQVRRVAPADAIGGNAPGQGADIGDFDGLLCGVGVAGERRGERRRPEHAGYGIAHGSPPPKYCSRPRAPPTPVRTACRIARMKILVSNDDGYFAPGISLLAEALRQVGEVTVVAPERDRSGASNSLTLDRPLIVRRAPNGYFSVNGTPTDCVHIAVTGLLEFTPDMVVSGINLGANMGDDTIYSGTVAAAAEGYLLGIPALAVSLTSKA